MKQDIICCEALDRQSLCGAVDEFLRTVRPQRLRLRDYYLGQQPVNKGETVRGRPNNLLRVPFPRYITEVHTGYFLGLPPTLAFADGGAAARYEALRRSLRLDHLLFDIGRDLSICGVGFLLVWAERSGLRACRCAPEDCFAIRSGEAGAPLRGAGAALQPGWPAHAGRAVHRRCRHAL